MEENHLQINQIWKQIPDFPDYEISHLGNIRSNKFGKQHILSPRPDKDGYWRVNISNKDKIRKTKYIHTLIMETFVGPRPNGTVIDHINQDKQDNRVENLRYTTVQQNCINCKRYRDDIEEQDRNKRNAILAIESYHRLKNGERRQRHKGTGSIRETTFGTFKTTISINNVSYSKTLKTKEEAEQYIEEVKKNNVSV